MATSVVYWSFKSSKETSTVAFEGTGISVFDLKKEIIASQKDRKSTRLNSSHSGESRMPSSA